MKLKPVTKLNGETTWCGPSVISSITGFPVALIVREHTDEVRCWRRIIGQAGADAPRLQSTHRREPPSV